MAASLLGEAAVRVVPTMRGFRTRVRTELERTPMHFDVDIRPKVDTSVAKKQMAAFRRKEEADAIELKTRIDEADFKRQFQRVEHVFERSAFAKALRLQVKVIGADALYSLAGAAGAAAAALQTLGGAALVIPGALAQAGVAAGVLALAFNDVSKAMTAYETSMDQAEDKARALQGATADHARAQRDVQRAHKDVGKAIRDTIRDMEDLAHAVRGTSLDEADALLNVQESFDRLREGGHQSLTQLRRDQLSYLQDLHRLDEVRRQNTRTVEDFNDAQQKGVSGSDQVVQALDAVADAENRVADAANRMADASQTKLDVGPFARLSPSAQEFVRVMKDADGVVQRFGQDMQEIVMQGQGQNVIDTLNVSLKNFGPGLQTVAGQLNGFFKDLGSTLRSNQNQSFLTGIVGDTSNTLSELRKGIDPLVTGILRLSDAAGDRMPAVMNMLNGFFERFDAWTQRVTENGMLDTWITQGIEGFQQLVDSGINLVTAIFAIADAWKVAGGEATGLFGNVENVTKSLKDWATSAEGQGSLIENFRTIRGWISQMVEAFKDMWPTLVEIGQTVREWSVTFFAILGTLFKMTAWVEEHTGLVKLMVAAYLTIRTVKPVWDTLTNAATAYSNLMMRMATMNGPMGQFGQNAVGNLASVQTAMGKTGTTAQTMAKSMNIATGSTISPLRRMQNGFMNLITPMSSTAAQLRSLNGFLPATSQQMTALGTAGTAASKQVGGGGAGKVGLYGAVASLAGFIGPGLAFTAAVAGAMIAIDKLGESHRNATRDAQNQQVALDNLKTSLDKFTGFASPQHLLNTAETLQQFDVPGRGKVDLLQLIKQNPQWGITPEQFVGMAGDPQQVLQREATVERLRQDVITPEIEKNEEFNKVKGELESRGIFARTVADAITGDAEAHKKLYEAWKEGGVDLPDWLSNMPGSGIMADLGGFMRGVNFEHLLRSGGDAASVALGLQNTGAANWGAAQQNINNSALVGGQFGLRPGNSFTQFNPAQITTNPTTGEGIVVLNSPPPPDIAKQWTDMGWGISQPDQGGRVQVTVPPEVVQNQFEKLPGLKTGGMVRGVGSGTSDSNIIRASAGEFIVRKKAVDAVGVHTLDAINSGRLPQFNIGGLPFPISPAPVPPPIPTPNIPTAAGETWQDILLPKAPPTGGARSPLDLLPKPAPVPAPKAPQHGIPGVTYPVPIAGAPAVLPGAPGAPGAPGTPHLPSSGSLDLVTPAIAPGASTATPGANTGLLSPGLLSGPMAVNPLTGLPSKFANIATGLQPNTLKTLQAVEAAFPQFNSIGGVRKDPLKWHPNGLALDLMIPGMEGMGNNDPTTPEGKAFGDQVWAWLGANADALGIDMGASLWQTKDHYNHIHVATTGNGPTAGGLTFGNGLQALLPGLGGLTGGGHGAGDGHDHGGFGDESNMSIGDRIVKRYQDAFKPENVNKFLFGQVENIGSSLQAIGFQALQSFTGLDLSGVAGHAQSLINHFTGSGGSGEGGSSSPIPGLDQAVTSDFGSFINNTGGTSGFDPMAGVDLNSIISGVTSQGTPGAGNKGTEQWLPIVQQVVQQLVAKGIISANEANAWVDAVMRQMKLESGGDPGAVNNWDSNAKKGTPSKGLMQMIESTFNAYRVPGIGTGEWMDPVSQIAASIAYTKSRYGGPHGMSGTHGYATGGSPAGGLIRISRGEYRMSPKAVSKYGVGFMHSLNRFDRGGVVGSDPRAQMQQAQQRGPGLPPSISAGIQEGASLIGSYAEQAMAQHQGQQPPGYAAGGMPIPTGAVIRPVLPPPAPVIAAKPMIPRPTTPTPAGPKAPAPKAGVAPTPGRGPVPHTGSGAAPGKPPVPGASAPASGQGVRPPTPGADRALSMVGGAPTRSSGDYLNPGIKNWIESGWNHAGQLGAMAAASGMSAGGIPGGGGAGMLIAQGAQVAGKWAAGIGNVISAALIGNFTEIGMGDTPSGAPLLPERTPQSFGGLPTSTQMAPKGSPVGPQGRVIMNQYFGGIHTSNLSEWQRRQQLLERQQEQPLTNSFAH